MVQNKDALEYSTTVQTIIYEEYMHRVGRTSRAWNQGNSYTFINPVQQVQAEDGEQG